MTNLDTTAPLTIGFDIGGTNLRGAVVDDRGQIVDSEQIPTPETAEALEDGIVHIVNLLRRRHEIAAVGLAVAAFLSPDCSFVRFAPHLPWRDTAVGVRLSQRLQLPVRLEHDANAAAWGEIAFGCAQEDQDWAFLALGTGIGGTLIVNGEIYRGAFGTAPEFGHLTVVPGGRRCPCGKRGCLERYCSGTAMATTAREMIGQHLDIDSKLLRRYRTRPDEITGRHITAGARCGDELALMVMDDFARWLGHGLAIIQDVFDPALIVLGGGVSHDHDLYLSQAEEVCAENIVGAAHRPRAEIRIAELGPEAGMVGVSHLARTMVTSALA